MLQENSADLAVPSHIPQISSLCLGAPEPTDTFSRGIMVENRDYLGLRATHSAISLGVHIATIAGLLILPLFSSTAPRPTSVTTEFVTIPLPASKEVPLRRPQISTAAKQVLSSLRRVPPVWPAPRTISNADDPLPPRDTFRSVSVDATEENGNVLGGVLAYSPARLVIPVPPENAHVVRLGGELKSTRLLYRLNLRYPALAKAAHIAGTVVIQAVIDETGKVSNVRAIRGSLLLSSAAMEAVSKERFEPMLLNGEPVKCDLTVEITFDLNTSFPD
jgi:protein TonB